MNFQNKKDDEDPIFIISSPSYDDEPHYSEIEITSLDENKNKISSNTFPDLRSIANISKSMY